MRPSVPSQALDEGLRACTGPWQSLCLRAGRGRLTSVKLQALLWFPMQTTSYGRDCILQRRTVWPGPSLLIPWRLSVDLVLYVVNTQQTSLVSQGKAPVKLGALCPRSDRG